MDAHNKGEQFFFDLGQRLKSFVFLDWCKRWEYGQVCYSRNFQESGKKCKPYLLKLITLGYFEQHLYVISIKRNRHNKQRSLVSKARNI